MSDYEIMAHQVSLPIAAEAPIVLPAGWEPIATLARQGNEAYVLCRRVATAPGGNVPVLSSLTPNSLAAGGVPATIDVAGTGFDSSCTVYADGTPRATFFLDATHLQYTSRPDLATSGDTVQITVSGDTGTTSALTFTFT